jgi:hypothetical protein
MEAGSNCQMLGRRIDEAGTIRFNSKLPLGVTGGFKEYVINKFITAYCTLAVSAAQL